VLGYVGLIAPINIQDEGYIVNGATRILAGQVPYRDYLFMYGPGQLYALALVFRTGGGSLDVERVYDSIIRMGILVLIFLILARATGSRWAALLTSALALISFSIVGFYNYPVLPALGLALLAAVCEVNFFFREMRPIFACLCGLFVGLAGLFRQDIGVLLVVAIISTGAILALVSARGNMRVASRTLVRGVAAWTIGIATAVVPALTALAILAGPGPLINGLVLYPLTGVLGVRTLPLPPFIAFPASEFAGNYTFRSYLEFTIAPWLTLYGTVAVFAASAVLVARRLSTRRPAPGELAVWLLAFSVAGLAFVPLGLSRFSFIHFLPAWIIASLLLGLIAGASFKNNAWPSGAVAMLGMVTLSAAFLIAPLRFFAANGPQLWPRDCAGLVERAACAPEPAGQTDAIQYIQKHTSQGEPIFVGNSRHDTAFVSDIMFYFLADRPNATSYDDLAPGVVTTVPVQQSIISDLERVPARYVVTSEQFSSSEELNDSRASSGVTLLDDFIRAKYGAVAHFGYYTVWVLGQPSSEPTANSQQLTLQALYPKSARSTEGFNVQPNGDSALAVVCDGAVPGTVVVFDSTVLSTTFGNPQLVTALVPRGLYATAGPHQVVLKNGRVTSNALEFTADS
jgi:hypothetical protein